ncbi:hypothetical protein [Clostridium sp. D53t1_180928_C8]|uniref:hypothetical protein n=1 Tax=Clostridium sp. D53t1_180928_C8 TaxID=2787101 RepID=UPI0018A9193E|nr:hypothetical protein [Clostridium sp. D53t1_180928_C8]
MNREPVNYDGMKKTNIKLGNTTVNIYRPIIPNEDEIIKLYDTCNKLFKNHPECFYTPEQTKEKNKLLAINNISCDEYNAISE